MRTAATRPITAAFKRLEINPILAGSLLAVGLLLLVWGLLEPRWESNDDVGMSMVAHGYGLAAIPSPQLIFSNVAWGKLVQLAGTVRGVSGYAVAMFLALAGVSISLLSWAWSIRLGLIGSIALFALVLLRPLLFPQFTITAGLLVICAVICWQSYSRSGGTLLLLIGALCCYISYTIRSQEFLLVLWAASPFLPWNKLFKDRLLQLTVSCLSLAILISVIANARTYQDPAWNYFNELNPVRAAFTDFDASSRVVSRPDVMERQGFTPNDIELVSTWFFVDPKIVDISKLESMLQEVGPTAVSADTLHSTWRGLAFLGDPALAWAVLAALILAALYPSKRVFVSWLLCLGAMALMGYLGRPGVLRVYVPLVALLVIAPLLCRNERMGQEKGNVLIRERVAVLSMIVLAACASWLTIQQSIAWARSDDLIQHEIADFPDTPVVVWGDMFPFESVYKPLRRDADRLPIRLFALGAFTHAPFSVAHNEQSQGRDFVSTMKGSEGVLLLAHDASIGRLAVYCKERHAGELHVASVRKYSFGSIRKVRCT